MFLFNMIRLLIRILVVLSFSFLLLSSLLQNSGTAQRVKDRTTNTTIIVVTPTHKRTERLADMIRSIGDNKDQKLHFRLSQTLSHVPNLHWIVIEDGIVTVPAVSWILHRSGVPHIYLATTTADGLPRRGWTHRNLALRYIRENYDRQRNAVLYFADDDNTYDLRLFNNYIRNVSRIGVWAVGLVGGAWVEAPHVSNEGKVIAWDVMFAPGRPFATDMAGFAINIKEVFRARHAAFNTNCAKNYKQGPESCFLSQFGFNKDHLEPFGHNDFPKEILVWHTRTTKSKTRGPKRGYTIE